MKRPGFSLSTFLIVVILLGAVAWVGSIVNPIKHAAGDGHDHENENVEKVSGNQPKDTGASNSGDTRKKIQQNEVEQRRQMMKMMADKFSSEKKKPGGAEVPMKDPEAIDPTPTHFFQAEMGAEGITKQREEVIAKKKLYDEQVARNRRSPFGRTVVPEGAEVPKSVKAGMQKANEEPGHEGHDH